MSGSTARHTPLSTVKRWIACLRCRISGNCRTRLTAILVFPAYEMIRFFDPISCAAALAAALSARSLNMKGRIIQEPLGRLYYQRIEAIPRHGAGVYRSRSGRSYREHVYAAL